ncbi:MAG: TetR/AcrR family transcriptional regulator [Tenericutes bacterium]|nr:TetR/AcrR family transcriptional regulator [Mycoplasmatota bacterium]
MPKKTFFNLPESKRSQVINASKKEFSRVPLANALVSNIIINAKIPRGSFYQYFDDIEDCFYFVVDEYSKDIKTKLINNIKDFNGDIIKSYHNLFLYILDMMDDNNNKAYFENLFLNMNSKIQKMFTPNFNDGLNNIINMVDVEKLNIQGKFSLGYVIDIIESLMIYNIIETYNRNMSKDKKIEIFEKELLLISRGIVK